MRLRTAIIAGWVGVALILGAVLWPASAGADSDGPELRFIGDVPAATQHAVRAELRSLLAFFREQLGADSLDYTIYVGPDAQALSDVYRQVFGESPNEGFCDKTNNTLTVTVISLECKKTPPYGFLWPHYLRVIEELAPWASRPAMPDGYWHGPEWLSRGSWEYVINAHSIAEGREERTALIRRAISSAAQITQPISTLDTRERFDEVGYWEASAVSHLAMQWLVERAGERAILDYYRQLAGARSWEQAFERAFGIAADDFYTAFEAHRAEIAPPLPHQTDDREEPVLEFVGDVSAATRTAVQAELANMLRFFRERLGANPVDYTIYVGADAQALSDVYWQVFGESPDGGFCDKTNNTATVTVISLECHKKPPYGLVRNHFWAAIDRLAPIGSLPAMPDGYWRGPEWLAAGGWEYVRTVYLTQEEPTDAERRAIAIATGLRSARTPPLKALDTWESYHAPASSAGAGTVGFLAIEWLVERAGERAVLDYYRHLPGSRSWEQAFERTFGIAVDDFYTAFEFHRIEIAEIAGGEPIRSPALLQPGWNVTAWLGPNTPVSGLFEEIPSLRAVYAWDSDAQRFRSAIPDAPSADLARLATGQALYLYLDGDAPFMWQRLALTGDVWLQLGAGRNFVAWAGRDGTPIERTVTQFNDDLARIWRWNAETGWREAQRSETMNQGDALWVELTEDAPWWQVAAGFPPVEFLGEFTEEEQADVLRWTEDVRTLFTERWNVDAPFLLYVASDRQSLVPVYRLVIRLEPNDRFCGTGGFIIFMLENCVNAYTQAHEYFHALQAHLAGGRSQGFYWLIEGSAEYAKSVYRALASGRTVAEQAEDNVRWAVTVLRPYDLPPLSRIDDFTAFHALPNGIGYLLGFLAADWLVRHSSEMAVIEFYEAYQELGNGLDEKGAFERAFGIALDDFYAAFEEYLRTLGLRQAGA